MLKPASRRVKHFGLSLLTCSVLFSVSGCSSISSGVESIGKGVYNLAETWEKNTVDVSSKPLTEDEFLLATDVRGPVTGFDSWPMRIKAREVCPDGYIYLSRQAQKQSEFANSLTQCSDGDCSYKLEWRIRCEDVPEEPFSLFGKT
ncbi:MULTISPECIES: hypothetical protein [Thiomicrorhabdus]|uniref:Lipoprotein n=1 Tax=Thiomicrorhabdus heinhorstiae TaxID=2748010 RepID=A0ABS0BXD0_9GAMM|nr:MULTISPECIES: hypothetical protein [Thiomicrorhabdus]MBF6058452.1 hypothetical protein [Thiomicrorhabdus heinhorstiae]